MQFEELAKEIKEYDKVMKEEFEEENLYENFELEENNNIINYNPDFINKKNNYKKFIVNFYFKLNEIKEFIFPIESDLFDIDNQYAYELIENIINKINNKSITINNNSNEYIISLKNCENNNKKDFLIENYELRLCIKKH